MTQRSPRINARIKRRNRKREMDRRWNRFVFDVSEMMDRDFKRLIASDAADHNFLMRMAKEGDRIKSIYGGETSGIDWDARMVDPIEEFVEVMS